MAWITIHHDPACGTSRNTLALIRYAGIEPEVIDYLDRPIGVTPLGARLCRPSEAVLEILPVGALAPFIKEDGEVAMDPGVRLG